MAVDYIFRETILFSIVFTSQAANSWPDSTYNLLKATKHAAFNVVVEHFRSSIFFIFMIYITSCFFQKTKVAWLRFQMCINNIYKIAILQIAPGTGSTNYHQNTRFRPLYSKYNKNVGWDLINFSVPADTEGFQHNKMHINNWCSSKTKIVERPDEDSAL